MCPFEHAFSITNIKAGFSKCGIYPFNPDAIQKANMVSSPSCCESSTPSPRVSSLSSQNSSGVLCFTPTLNPLLKAGLIPPDLVDILAIPPTATEPTKRITGARELTANEYYEWLQAEELKKKEAAEAKQRKAEERRRRKREREEERKHKQDEREKNKRLAEESVEKQTSQNQVRNEATTSTARCRLPMEDEPANDPEEEEQGSSTADGAPCPNHHRQLPIRFQDSDS